MDNEWKDSLSVSINARKVDKLTNEKYDELSKKADENIRKNNIVNSENQKEIRFTKFLGETNEK